MVTGYVSSQEYMNEIYEKDAVGRIKMNISVRADEVQNLVRAMKSYFENLRELPVEPDQVFGTDEVFVAGGWVYAVKWYEGAAPRIVLESAGQDATSSLEIASENLMEVVLLACPDVCFSYEELPVRLAGN